MEISSVLVGNRRVVARRTKDLKEVSFDFALIQKRQVLSSPTPLSCRLSRVEKLSRKIGKSRTISIDAFSNTKSQTKSIRHRLA